MIVLSELSKDIDCFDDVYGFTGQKYGVHFHYCMLFSGLRSVG
jgi:hypothetical protein